ncbi:MAG: YhfC family glutamic-type intramembrane protease [Terrisporobacter sp.]
MSIHIGFSMIVLYGIRRNKIIYLFIAILLHGIVDGLLGILPKVFNLGTIGMEVYVFI